MRQVFLKHLVKYLNFDTVVDRLAKRVTKWQLMILTYKITEIAALTFYTISYFIISSH